MNSAVRPFARLSVSLRGRPQLTVLSVLPEYLFPRPFSSPPSTIYRHLSPIQQILLRPDTFIGSPIPTTKPVWIYSNGCMSLSSLIFSPAFLKIFDEILINAADNKERDKWMKEIRVRYDRETGEISVWNDGRGLPVEKFEESELLVPTVVFGTLNTSSNYDDTVIRNVGGRNGLGAKLANIFSRRFRVTTASSSNGKIFSQEWTENMSTVSPPIVSQLDEVKEFTEVTFLPDYGRFGMDGLDENTVMLLERRVRDLAATIKGVRVVLNGQEITTNDFREYAVLYVKGEERRVFHQCPSRKFEIVIGLRDNESDEPQLNTVSFVNNCITSGGGRHVDFVWKEVLGVLRTWMEKRNGKGIRLSKVKERLVLCLNTVIDNPSFTGQNKDTLSTPTSHFSSYMNIDSNALIKWAEEVELHKLFENEKTDKKKNGLLSDRKPDSSGRPIIAKLDDAMFAGGKRSSECSLILTEGDSAKALAVAGLQVVGRERFGVYPLKGKLTNITGMEEKKATNVTEVETLMKILGLQSGIDYRNPVERARLRYGRVILFTDQDDDGSHIRGLVLNVFLRLFPSLLQSPFIAYLDTPLIKCRRGSWTLSFYTRDEYSAWEQSVDKGELAKWNVKYYKGLGTSTSEEAIEYFNRLEESLVYLEWKDPTDDEAFNVAFDKDRTEERKKWIEEATEIMDTREKKLSLSQFVHTQLKPYAIQDLRRSIPNVIDGLKPSQRKILHTSLRLGEGKEMKVAQFGARVAQTCSYHHGESSLNDSIIRMAQNFVGSSNVPLLKGIGQFGTRHNGGNDAANARYIYISLSRITRILFPAQDDSLLHYIVDEGMTVEPKWFCPIVPVVLLNGSEGIGTGWSTFVPSFDPFQVIDYVRCLIHGLPPPSVFMPKYLGFEGKTKDLGDGRVQTSGLLTVEKKRRNGGLYKISIDELPIGKGTNDYKEKVLLPLATKGIIRDIRESHNEQRVKFDVDMLVKELTDGKGVTKEVLLNKLKLVSTFSTNKMFVFDSTNRLRHFPHVSHIFNEHFNERRQLYIKRLQVEESKKIEKLAYCRDEVTFIKAFVAGRIPNGNLEEMKRKAIEEGCRGGSIEKLLDIPLSRLTKEEEKRLVEMERKMEEEVKREDWKEVWNRELNSLEKALKGKQRKSS